MKKIDLTQVLNADNLAAAEMIEEAMKHSANIFYKNDVRIERTACPSMKVSYSTKADAMRALQALKKTSRSSVASVYQCPFCNKYHLTSYSKGYKRKRR